MSIGTAEGYHVASISCGRDHTLALLASGNVIGWGGDGSGRVAATTPEYCSTAYGPERPVEVKLASPLTSIAAGYGVSPESRATPTSRSGGPTQPASRAA